SRTALAFPLSIDDQRPAWEKHSQDYRVEFVALEECIDPCWNLLADALQRETSRWPEPPCRATLELRSFRVVNKPEAVRLAVAPLERSERMSGCCESAARSKDEQHGFRCILARPCFARRTRGHFFRTLLTID